MSKFNVGDRVKTEFGTGKIVEINKYGNNLVYHDNWNERHNNGCDAKGCYAGEHCWWFSENELELLETTNEIKFNVMPERYVINKGATVLFWGDGTKTIVKRSKDDEYNKRLGFLTAYFQKTSGMSKTKANKYLDSLVEQNIKEKTKTKTKVSSEEIEQLDKIVDKLYPNVEKELREFADVLLKTDKTKSKYKVGDKVKVIHTGNLYTTYPDWFRENNCKELAEYYVFRQYPDTTKIHKIVAIGTHDWDEEKIILAIRPLHSKKIYLIGQEGVNKA